MKNKLLIKGGRLIDPASGYRGEPKDILVEDGCFKQIAADLIPEPGVEVLTLDGEYVAPGFIDAHVHAYTAVPLGVDPDTIGIETGVTTVIDAGSAGPENIADFIARDIRTSRTRVFAAMHYAKTGLADPPEADREDKYDLELVKFGYEKYKEYIVAIKARASKSCVGKLGITSIRAGKQAANALGLPLMVHIGNMPPTIEEVLEVVGEGDVITHAFHGKANNLFVDGQLKAETKAARERGVLFDIGHGKESYNFHTGEIARKLGFEPDIISTDLHAQNYQGPVYSLSITLDKMLAMGFDLASCIDKVTYRPAKYYGLKRLGSIKEGYHGDLTIFAIDNGVYHFSDSDGNQVSGTQSIKVKYVVSGGEVAVDKSVFETVMEKAKSELNLPAEKFAQYAVETETVIRYLKGRGIVFAEANMLAFIAHFLTMLSRLETGEKVDEMSEAVLEQIDQHAVELTRKIFKPLEEKYGLADTAEIVLAAIHIQTAMEMINE